MARRIKILNYAVNGSGLGHVTRLIAINRWIDRLAAACGVEAEIYFLTTSEADSLVWRNGFASFKLPSKTAIKDSRIAIESYLRMARQWVWNALNLVHPDLLIVDTFPNGSFGELVNALDLARHKAFVYREMKPGFARRPAFQAMLPLYDQIIVPHSKAEASLVLPESVRGRTVFAGPIIVRDREELLARDEARRRLGIPDGRLAVYLSAGGGGDDTADRTLTTLMDALEPDPDLHLVVGAGPLYRGVPRRGPNVTWLTECDTIEMLPGIDLAFSASGYNSFSELMYLGIPTVFYAQEKVADIQDQRLERAVGAGAAVRLPAGGASASPSTASGGQGGDATLFRIDQVREVVAGLKDASRREAMRDAARQVVPGNAARAAAGHLLSAVLPPQDVEEALEAVTPRFLATLRRLELPLEAGVNALKVLGTGTTRTDRRRLRAELEDTLGASGIRGQLDGRSLETLGQAIDRRYPDDLDGGSVASAVTSRLERWAGIGVPPAEGLRITELVLRRARLAHLAEAPKPLVTHLDALLEAFARFQDWRAAGLFVQSLPARADNCAAVLREAAHHLLEHHARGEDLYRAMATSSTLCAAGDDSSRPALNGRSLETTEEA